MNKHPNINHTDIDTGDHWYLQRAVRSTKVGFHWSVWLSGQTGRFLLVDHCQQSTERSTGPADSPGSTGLTGISCIDNFNLFWGQRHLFRADGLHPSRSGVKVLMDHLRFSLRHPSARPKMMHPDTQQPRHHEDKTSQPQCQRDDNQLMDQSPNSSSLPSLTPCGIHW